MFFFCLCVCPQDDFLYSVSIVSGLSCAVLAVAKFMLGKKLTSRALTTDGRKSAYSYKIQRQTNL